MSRLAVLTFQIRGKLVRLVHDSRRMNQRKFALPSANAMFVIWSNLAAVFRRQAHLEPERAKTELKSLLPDDAKQAFGHGVRARRSRSSAVNFDLLDSDTRHAPVQ